VCKQPLRTKLQLQWMLKRLPSLKWTVVRDSEALEKLLQRVLKRLQGSNWTPQQDSEEAENLAEVSNEFLGVSMEKARQN
jgi:hypothetical protein